MTRRLLILLGVLLAALLLAPRAASAIAIPGAAALVDSGPVPPPLVVADSIFSRHFRLRMFPQPACPEDTMALEVEWCPQCATLQRLEVTHPSIVRMEVAIGPDTACYKGTCLPDLRRMRVRVYPAGEHVLPVEVLAHLQQGAPGGGGTPWDAAFIHAVPFSVTVPCGTPPPPSRLPYVDRITFRSVKGGRVCALDSILVHLEGHFPDDCHLLRRAEVIQPVCVTTPCPPQIRLLVDDGACLGRPCIADSVYWQAFVVLPPVGRSGEFRQPIGLWKTTCSDSFPPGPPLGAVAEPFHADTCMTPWTCLTAAFGPAQDLHRCDAYLDGTDSVAVTLHVRTNVPLAGLQGELKVVPRRLDIVGMRPVGPAAGMQLVWQTTPQGASFVMFAPRGTPIPAWPPDGRPNLGAPVLEVWATPRTPADDLIADHSPGLPDLIRIVPQDLLGADSLGREVRECPQIAAVVLDPAARICTAGMCDANGDGRTDVRDLVVMVRCLRVSCPDSARFDCDEDGDFSLDDVLCCAHRVLRRPPGTPGEPGEQRVAVRIEGMERDGATWRLTVRVENGDVVGAGKIVLGLPDASWQVLGVEAAAGAAQWLALHDVNGSELSLGVIDAGAGARALGAGSGGLELQVRLELPPGVTPGAMPVLRSGEFATADGQAIAVDLGPAPPSGVPARLALAPGQPNPFSRSTSFAVDLDRASRVELTVHDLSGRRVATLHQGELPAGRRSFTWDGSDGRGTALRDGVYFVRLVSDGRVVGRKVALLRTP